MPTPTRQELLRMGPWATSLVKATFRPVWDASSSEDEPSSDGEDWPSAMEASEEEEAGSDANLAAMGGSSSGQHEAALSAPSSDADEDWEAAEDEPAVAETGDAGHEPMQDHAGEHHPDAAPIGSVAQAADEDPEDAEDANDEDGEDDMPQLPVSEVESSSSEEELEEELSESDEDEVQDAEVVEAEWQELAGAQHVMFVLSAASMRALDHTWMRKILDDEPHPAACSLREASRRLQGPARRGAPLTAPAVHRAATQIPTSSPHFQTADVLAIRRCRPPGQGASAGGGLDVVVFRVALLGVTTHGWLGFFHLPADTSQPPQFQAAFPVPIVSVYSVAASADGSFVAACGDGGHLLVMQLEEGPPGVEGSGGGAAEGGEGAGAAAGLAVRQSWVLAPGGVRRRHAAMLNSVKFCRIGGRERLLVARQGNATDEQTATAAVAGLPGASGSSEQAAGPRDPPGMLFVYDVPPPLPPTGSTPAPSHPTTPTSSAFPDRPPTWLSCTDLPPAPTTAAPPADAPDAAPPAPPDFPLRLGFTFPHPLPPPPLPQYHYARSDAVHYCPGPPPARTDLRHAAPAHRTTLALGPFPTVLNFAVASPDGRWLGITHDSPSVLLVDAWQQRPRVRQLPFPALSVAGGRRAVACQNAAFNAASTLLAASSDHSLSVYCWHLPSGGLTLHLSSHERPCIPLAFVPPPPPPPEDGHAAGALSLPGPACNPGAADTLLVYAEEAGMLHIVDTAAPSTAHQLVACPRPCPQPHSPLQRINGLAVSPSGRVLVAGWSTLHEFQLVLQWDAARHPSFPPAFRTAVLALLMLSRTHPATGAPLHPSDIPTGFWRLPPDVLLHIISLAAFPLAAWLPPLVRNTGWRGALLDLPFVVEHGHQYVA